MGWTEPRLHSKVADMPPTIEAELVLTNSSLRIRSPVVRRHKTPYEVMAGHPPKLGHLRRVAQWKYAHAQARKPQTGWKKFQNRAVLCRLGYESNHIYRMLSTRYSNVRRIHTLPEEPIQRPNIAETTESVDIDTSPGPTPKRKTDSID